EERGECAPQGQVVGAVDFADAKRRLAFGTWNTHLALVVHAVACVRFVLVRERLAVSRGLCDRVVTGDVPESAVLLVPRDGTPAPEIGVDPSLVEVELVGMVIESDDRVGTDVGAAH